MPVARLVARHPPHRTVLALLTHTVPRDPGELFGCFYPVLHRNRWPSTPRNRLGIPQYPHTPILVRAAISGLYYSSLSLRVAVGTAVARCPPHSPVLAPLVHTVPTLDVWRRSAHWDKGVQYWRKEFGQPAAL